MHYTLMHICVNLLSCVAMTLYMYSGSHYFESRSGYFLPRLRFFVVFFQSFQTSNQDSIWIKSLQFPSKSFPIHHPPAIDIKCIWYEELTAWWNKLHEVPIYLSSTNFPFSSRFLIKILQMFPIFPTPWV
jgi:hypothetical protein